MWDAETSACLRTLKGHTDNVLVAAISADGARVVAGSFDKLAKVWDAPSFPRHDIAFAMALQPRLGAGCLASELDPEVVKLIGEQFTGRAGLGVARLDVIILWQ